MLQRQVCGCVTALLRLLGSQIWKHSSLDPSEVLEAIERQARDKREDTAPAGRRGLRPNEAVHMKVLEALPFLVSSATAMESSRVAGGNRDDRDCDRGSYPDGDDRMEGRETPVGVGGDGPENSLADDALSFLSTEMSSLSGSVAVGGCLDSGADMGSNARRTTALTRALLAVLETCYGRATGGSGVDGGGYSGGNDGSQRGAGPESWPWNSVARVDVVTPVENAVGGGGAGRHGRRDRWFPPSWPVRSLPSWGPRLAEKASERFKGAAAVMELVLREHAGAVWREALSALREGSNGPEPLRAAKGSGGPEVEKMLPICEPLLKLICLVLPLRGMPVGVHAAVFQAHGWLALVPCGNFRRLCLYPWRESREAPVLPSRRSCAKSWESMDPCQAFRYYG